MKTVELSKIECGKTFKIGEIEFIKFTDEDGKVIVVTKDSVFRSEFGKNNNLSESKIIERLNSEVLPKIVEEVGEENVCEFETDLTTLDGLKPYAPFKSKVSLPTFDFYRANVEIFDKYKLDEYWWLATPDTALPHYNPSWGVCVSPSGYIFSDYYCDYFAVRPFFIFLSSILVSCDE